MARTLLTSILLAGVACAQLFSSSTSSGASITRSASMTSVTGPALTVFQGGSVAAGFQASIVSADPCRTTYAFSCTNALSCATTGVVFTATEGPSSWGLSYSTSLAGTSVNAIETCAISGSTSAICVATATATVGGSAAVVATTVATRATYITIPVVNGASIPTGTCASADYNPPASSAIGQGTTKTGAAAPTAMPMRAGIPVLAAAAAFALL